jgi:hypothetical protein
MHDWKYASKGWERRTESLSIRIHHHRDAESPEDWFLTVHELGIDCMPLSTAEITSAKFKAMDRVRDRITKLMREVT